MKRDCHKRKKDLTEEKPSIMGIVEGSSLFDRGYICLATTKSLEKSYWIIDSG